jgi:hypothetical protein
MKREENLSSLSNIVKRILKHNMNHKLFSSDEKKTYFPEHNKGPRIISLDQESNFHCLTVILDGISENHLIRSLDKLSKHKTEYPHWQHKLFIKYRPSFERFKSHYDMLISYYKEYEIEVYYVTTDGKYCDFIKNNMPNKVTRTHKKTLLW